jgi:tRNA threonylcarbamoyladenosine biosynthesis protein TsaB
MKILALEFSTDRRSVALTVGGRVLARAEESGTRASHPFHLIRQALSEARLEQTEIECLAVGVGPGSYTGIRTAIAIAQGWQLARPVRLLALNSLDCLAAQLAREGRTGEWHLVVDAQRGDLYRAVYSLDGGEFARLEPLAIASLAEVRASVPASAHVAGPEATRWFPEALAAAPGAETLGCLAASRTQFLDGGQLEPIYLREVSFVKAPPPRQLNLDES